MASRLTLGLALAVGAVLLSFPAVGECAADGREMEFPHAGIALTLPEGFSVRVVEEPFDVVRAVRLEGETSIQGMTLSAYWVAAGTSVEAYADQLTDELRQNLAVRHLTILKKVPDFAVAGRTGAACVMKYTYRGDRTAAARVCFLRELPESEQDICYALLIEAPESRQAQVLPVLGEVLKTLSLIPVRRPWQVPVGPLGSPYHVTKGGFSVRPPRGWFIEESVGGIAMGQMDYLQGGTQWVQITAQPMAESRTSEEQAQDCIRRGRGRFPNAEVLDEGPVTIAGRDGYQFVLRRPAPQPATQAVSREAEPPLMVVQNALCVPGTGSQPGTHYSMILTSTGGEVEELRRILDRVLEGLTLHEIGGDPTTAPADEAGPALPETRPVGQ